MRRQIADTSSRHNSEGVDAAKCSFRPLTITSGIISQYCILSRNQIGSYCRQTKWLCLTAAYIHHTQMSGTYQTWNEFQCNSFQESSSRGNNHSEQQHLRQCANAKVACFDTQLCEEVYKYRHPYDSLVWDYKDSEIPIIISGGRVQSQSAVISKKLWNNIKDWFIEMKKNVESPNSLSGDPGKVKCPPVILLALRLC